MDKGERVEWWLSPLANPPADGRRGKAIGGPVELHEEAKSPSGMGEQKGEKAAPKGTASKNLVCIKKSEVKGKLQLSPMRTAEKGKLGCRGVARATGVWRWRAGSELHGIAVQ